MIIAIYQLKALFKGFLPPIIKVQFYYRDTSKSANEDPAYERVNNSRLSG